MAAERRQGQRPALVDRQGEIGHGLADDGRLGPGLGVLRRGGGLCLLDRLSQIEAGPGRLGLYNDLCPGLAAEQDDDRGDGQNGQDADEDGGFLLVDHGRVSFGEMPLLETTRAAESSA